MFTDIPEFAAATGKSLLDSFAEIITPNNITVKLTQVATNYGQFAAGDVIGGYKYGGLEEVVTVNAESVIATTMSTRKETRLTDDARNVVSYMEVVDTNPDGRWVDMEVTAKPIRGVDGLNPFIIVYDVYEMEKRGEG